VIYNTCLGDFNNDGDRNTTDLLFFLGDYGCTIIPCVADLNDDGVTNTADVLVFLSVFGIDCP
jgi:hypothetical protein